MKRLLLATIAMLLTISFAHAQPAEYKAMVESHAAANGIPASLVHRVIMRESRYNPRAVHAGNYGMMQIKLQTARGLGYTGTAQGLLDPETNLTYAVKYLAGAYRVARGNPDRAVSYYARGYYYAAKRQRLLQANAEQRPLNLLPVGDETSAQRHHRHRRHLASENR
jgi:soluble lytic murein transglycosylase-like protein